MKSKPRQKFYRGKYLIAMCENYGLEYVYKTFDNAWEMAEFLNRDIYSIRSTLHHLFRQNRKLIYEEGRSYEIVFIELTSQEMENYYGKKKVK